MRGQNDSTIDSGILRSVNFVNMIIDGDCLVMSLHGICFTVMKEKEDQLPFGKNCKHTKKKNWLLFLFSRCRDQKWITTFAPDTEL